MKPPSGKFETVEDLEGQLIVGSPEEAVAEVKKFEDLGTEHLVFDFRFKFDRFFERHGPQTVFIARFVTGFRVFGAVLTGASGLGWPTFLFYNTTGAVVWSASIAAAGYSMAYSWESLERWIGRSGLVALVAVTALAVVIFLRSNRRSTP